MTTHRLYSTQLSKLKRNVFGIYLLNLCHRMRSLSDAATEMKMTTASVRNYLSALEDINREQLFRIEAGVFVLTAKGSALLARNAALIGAMNALTGQFPEQQNQFLICCQPSVMSRIIIPNGKPTWSYYSSSRPEDLSMPADVTVMRTSDPVLIRRAVVSFPEELVFLQPSNTRGTPDFFVGEPHHESVIAKHFPGLSYRFNGIHDPIAVVAFSRHSGATAIARLFYCATDIATSFWNAVYAETGEDCLCIWSKSESPEVGSVIAHIRNHIAHLRSIYVPRS
jgi:molybdenum-dependent DNA-binding transcriptional regulator ModE